MRKPVALLPFALSLLTAPLPAQTTQTAPLPLHTHNNLAFRRDPLLSAQKTLPLVSLTPQEQTAQVLNRFTFGPTPGMAQAVAAMGWQGWFAQQLHPEAIPDAMLDKRLLAYPSLTMTPAELAVRFPDGQVIRKLAEGKQSPPTDPQLAGVYQVMLAKYQAKQERDRAAAGTGASLAAKPVTPSTQTKPEGGDAAGQAGDQAAKQVADQATGQAAKQAAEQAAKQAANQSADQSKAATLAGPILAMPPAARLNAVLALPVADRVTLTSGLKEPLKGQLLQGVPPHDRELLATMTGGGNVSAGEMEQAKVLRAVLSQRQLSEVMTDFWVNHFNIDLNKGGNEIDYAQGYERDAIRPHALGKFRDLLQATAQSPAMLLYLDNATSTGPDSPAARRQQPGKAGLNENYGRELMELHTLGVDGGYTQADVTALANILTGWTVQQPQQGGPFAFLPQRHEPGTKQWLGHAVPENGEQEGIDALSYLARQPATARHVCYELAQRFVNDTPQPALVNRMVAAWQASDGDIAQVLTAMVHAPEFFDRANVRNKVKSPLEFVASALRATGTDPSNPSALTATLRAMGEPLYRCQPPTGYPVTGAQWMNSSALIDRLNFAVSLSDNKLNKPGGMHLDAPLLVADGLLAEPPATTGHAHPAAMVKSQPASNGEARALELMEQALLGGSASPQTTGVIHEQLRQLGPQPDATETLNKMAAMLLGSPEFQLH